MLEKEWKASFGIHKTKSIALIMNDTVKSNRQQLIWMKPRNFLLTFPFIFSALLAGAQHTKYPVERPLRKEAAKPEGRYDIYPNQLRQVVKGLGVEIYSDALNLHDDGMNMTDYGMLHDITRPERQRVYKEMLKGFRYLRLAGGLYLRGMDKEKKQLQGRWPEQMDELSELMRESGVEGFSFEYWSPLPYWKANGKLTGRDNTENVLRCFGSDFKNDPVYHGDTARFLDDFSTAVVKDIQFLKHHQLHLSFFGLQNEPMSNTAYSSCTYKLLPREAYKRVFTAVAKKVRKADSTIKIIGDSQSLKLVWPIVKDPRTFPLIDYMVMHHGGVDSKQVTKMQYETPLPLFQNEYSYSGAGDASPARCLNTLQHILNWFQRREAPSWFWLHALLPYNSGLSSGRALGLYRPIHAENDAEFPKGLKPGHWIWNPYNWYAVGSIMKHMPWDCRVVKVKEYQPDEDLRILAYKRPNGKLTIVLSNRSFGSHTFHLHTAIVNGRFKGYRYTPDEAGKDFMGIEIGELNGNVISPVVADMSWEFWEEQ